MGWTSGYHSRRQIQEETFNNFPQAQILRYCWRGNNLWYAVRDQLGGPDFIALVICERRRGGWGWAAKHLSEADGPVDYCPRTLRNAVPDPKIGYSTEWRARCAAKDVKDKERRQMRAQARKQWQT